jgi:hypothetical protein
MSSEIHLKRENDRLRREISELKAKIAALVPKQPEASKESPAPEKKPFDPWAPTGDAVFDALRSRGGQPKRRSWLNE